MLNDNDDRMNAEQSSALYTCEKYDIDHAAHFYFSSRTHDWQSITDKNVS